MPIKFLVLGGGGILGFGGGDFSEKRAGVKRACPNKVMAHIWFMHDAHLGRAFLFLDMLAE